MKEEEGRRKGGKEGEEVEEGGREEGSEGGGKKEIKEEEGRGKGATEEVTRYGVQLMPSKRNLAKAGRQGGPPSFPAKTLFPTREGLH